MNATKAINKNRAQISVHPALRARAEQIAAKRGLSFSAYLEELIKDDVLNPAPSPYDPIQVLKTSIDAVAPTKSEKTEMEKALRRMEREKRPGDGA